MMRNTYLYYLLVLVAFLSACARTEESIMPEQFSLEDAKQWFEQEIAPQPNARIPLKRIIDWQNAKQRTFQDNLPVWIVPIRYEDGSVMAMIQDENEQKITNPEKIEASGIQVEEILILFKRNDIGKKAWISQLMPDVTSTDPTKLSGYVVVKDWQGKFVKGYDYLGGNVVREYATNQFSNARVTDCLTKTIDWWSVYVEPSTGTQHWQFMHTETKWVCTGTASSYSGGGSGGAGSKWFIDGEDFTVLSQSNYLAKIARNISMTENQKKLLNETLIDYIDAACFHKQVYNQLVARNFKIDFNINSTIPYGAPGGYNPNTRVFSFRTPAYISYTSVIGEELYHAYQDSYYPNGTAQYTNIGRSNVEFETKLFTDIVNMVEGLPSSSALGMPDGTPRHNDYMNWISQITNNYTQTPKSLDMNKYFEFLTAFSTDYPNPAYRKPVDLNLKPDALLNLFNSTTKCK